MASLDLLCIQRKILASRPEILVHPIELRTHLISVSVRLRKGLAGCRVGGIQYRLLPWPLILEMINPLARRDDAEA